MRALYTDSKLDSAVISRSFDFNPWLLSIGATFVSATVGDVPNVVETYVIENGVVTIIAAEGVAGTTYRIPITAVASNDLVRATVWEVAVLGVADSDEVGETITVIDALTGSSTTSAPSVRAVNEGLAGKAALAAGITQAERDQLAGLSAALLAKIDVALLGAAGGVATLDGTGKLLEAQLPSVAVATYLGVVADEAAMLLLDGSPGDFCTRTDLGTTFIVTGDAGTPEGWLQLAYPSSPVSSVAGKTGAVTLVKGDVGLANVDNTSDAAKPVSSAQATAIAAKADTVHAHATADVTGLQAALDAKAAASHAHEVANVNGLQAALDGKAASTHAHAISSVTGLQTSLDGKAAAAHEHAISGVTGLQTALDGKAAAAHEHATDSITGLQALLGDLSAAINATGDIDGGTANSAYVVTPVLGGAADTDFGNRKPVNGGRA